MNRYVFRVGFAALSLLSVGACGQEPEAAETPTPAGPAPSAEKTAAEGATEPEADVAGGSEDAHATLADAAAGKAFHETHQCGTCHMNDDDTFAPPIAGVDADSVLAWMDGTAPHSGGAVDGVTAQDAANLAAFLAEQE